VYWRPSITVMGGRVHVRPKAICTIGYEGGTVDAFIRALKRARVELVLDIRAAPVSHKKGFSKNQLAAHLSEAGIGYRHLRGLGTPKRGREAARAGDLEGFERIFLAHMDEPEALLDLGEAIALAKAQPVCLLCLERDPEHCHRLIVGNRMVRETGQGLRHLFVEAAATPPD
ncbi:MAG TPA: DUF488 domain-containing protein, partial [Methyloceanibacter sp.]|nr:DUF488 domain-containing protein [Methyloceanibacter sp.]